MSLTSCIRKAGKLLSQEDKTAIERRALELRKTMDRDLADRQAVKERLDEVAAKKEAIPKPTLAQAPTTTPRATFDPKSLTIALNANADLTSFLHESGHFFLEVMADLASQQTASAGIRSDMDTVLKWFGVKDLATWNAMTLDEKRPYHERYAESIEQYLMEGKAPSLELQPIFRRFRSWLMRVYKDIKSFLASRGVATPEGEFAQPAYHGTPHRFDKFSTEHIGKGEGAQAYGWGLYFASKKEIAEHYRKALQPGTEIQNWSAGSLRMVANGDYVDYSPKDNTAQAEARAMLAERLLIAESDVRAAFEKDGIEGARRVMLEIADGAIDARPDLKINLGVFRKNIQTSLRFDAKVDPGQLYEVDIPEDDTLLLWDKPLSEQPEKVRDALAPFVERHIANQRKIMSAFPAAEVEREINAGLKSITGQGIYEQSGYMEAGGDRSASEYLTKLGIKGIKYLDGTSRSQGEGSYNYVIFSGDDVAVRKTFYQGGAPGANIQLSDEVRQVFDRMLASEEQIRQAEEVAGMLPDEKATNEAIDKLTARTLRDMKWLSNAKSKALKALQARAKDLRNGIRTEVAAEVAAMPEFQAKEALDKIASETKSAPTDADMQVVADSFGFSSVDHMLQSIQEAGTKSDLIRSMTDQRMLERHGEFVDAQSLEEAANFAIHNDARAKVLAAELKAQQEALGARETVGTNKAGSRLTVSVLAKAAKNFADNIVGRAKIIDLKKLAWDHTSAERRAAKRWMQATTKGDTAAAVKAKQDQVLNNAAAKSAMDASEEVQKILSYFDRIDTAGARKSRRGDYLLQRDALLSRFDLRKSLTREQVEERRPLAQWVQDEAERLSAVVPDLPQWVLNEGFVKSYKDMTIDELRAVKDSVAQLDHMAKREQQQYIAIKKQTFQEEKGALLARIRQTHPEAFDADGNPTGVAVQLTPSMKRTVESLQDKAMAEFINVETFAAILDGADHGPVHDSLMARNSIAADKQAERLGAIYKELKPYFNAYNLAEKIAFGKSDIGTKAGIGIALTRENAVVVALLNGSQEGRERLANYGWDQRTVQSIIDLLDKRDINLANGIWKMFDEGLWPELKALNERTKGQAPPKVEAVKAQARNGELSGGYFPLKYDSDLDERAKRLEAGAEVKNMLGGNNLGMSGKTMQGSSNERVQGVKMRPLLTLQVMSWVANETVHDIAYREAIADTMRLLHDSDVQKAMKVALGVNSYRAIVTRIAEVASRPHDPTGFIEKAATVARKNTVIALMSGVKTALQNLTGYFPGVSHVDAGYLSQEIAKFYSPKMKERAAFALEHSAYIRNLAHNYERDLNTSVEKLTLTGKIMPDTSAFLWLMGQINFAVAVPVWNASFREGMDKFGNDIDQASEYADSMVRATQGSGRAIDLAAIQTGHPVKQLLTMFTSYFLGQLNLLVRSGAIAKQEAKTNPVGAAAKFSAQVIAIVMMPAILTEFLMNGIEGADPDENQIKRWMKVLGRYLFGMVPIARDMYALAISKWDPDQRYHSGYKMSPVVSGVEGVFSGAESFVDIARGEGDRTDVKNAIMGVGFAFGLPGKLVSDTVAGTNAWLSGDEGAGPQSVILGPPKR